jgi:hypothetical protein
MKKRELEFSWKTLKQQPRELTQKSDAAMAGLLDSIVALTRRADFANLSLV